MWRSSPVTPHAFSFHTLPHPKLFTTRSHEPIRRGRIVLERFGISIEAMDLITSIIAFAIYNLPARVINIGLRHIVIDIKSLIAFLTSRLYWLPHLRLCLSLSAAILWDRYSDRLPLNLIDTSFVFSQFASSIIPRLIAAGPSEPIRIVWFVHQGINIPMAPFVVVSPEIVIVIWLFLTFAQDSAQC
jgi:hypothetical protein